jgi:hypothetical protein
MRMQAAAWRTWCNLVCWRTVWQTFLRLFPELQPEMQPASLLDQQALSVVQSEDAEQDQQ